jgi:hypothetical protein
MPPDPAPILLSEWFPRDPLDRSLFSRLEFKFGFEITATRLPRSVLATRGLPENRRYQMPLLRRRRAPASLLLELTLERRSPAYVFC